jgi:hypothetical protein
VCDRSGILPSLLVCPKPRYDEQFGQYKHRQKVSWQLTPIAVLETNDHRPQRDEANGGKPKAKPPNRRVNSRLGPVFSHDGIGRGQILHRAG